MASRNHQANLVLHSMIPAKTPPTRTDKRLFSIAAHIQVSEKEPIRSVVAESADSVTTVWHVLQGQQVAPHTHPHGQDTWIVLAGQADYISDIVDGMLQTQPIEAGMVVIAHAGQIHGAIQRGSVPFQFVSVVAPFTAGFQLALSESSDKNSGFK